MKVTIIYTNPYGECYKLPTTSRFFSKLGIVPRLGERVAVIENAVLVQFDTGEEVRNRCIVGGAAMVSSVLYDEANASVVVEVSTDRPTEVLGST